MAASDASYASPIAPATRSKYPYPLKAPSTNFSLISGRRAQLFGRSPGPSRANILLTKQNTISDFIGCAEYLIQNKYSSPQHLAIRGGSAGGITVGGAITQRPELFAAAADLVPSSDMLRSGLSPNGPPNIPEFGSVKTDDGFKGLYSVSG